ncbi:MAG: glutamate synthase, partial [Dehalococcoidia bacterium]
GKTSKPRVWCGGDMATGAATVISAMGAAKRAATNIDAYLRG